ncbi:MAG: hypothetical protein FWG41_03155 [Methanomassiliicoccaceae archaeon]|nr:hypothetical protein [Methanomassiliicoccaceae archaeon]
MSPDARTVESLTALYMSQSPAAFTSIAMHTKEPNDHSKRVDEAEHGGISECDYPCCNDRGCCSSGWWYAGLGVCVVGCCAFCCYITEGFNGVWTYWPF